MTPNEQTVETYLEGFRRTDREMILSCLTEDIEWSIPGAFHTHGRDEFAGHIVDDDFRPHPQITVTRRVEAPGEIVVVEGTVRTEKKDGTVLHLAFCDLFEMEDGKVRRLTSYLMPIAGGI